MLLWYMLLSRVCPSICLSKHIVSKHLNLGLCKQCHMLALGLSFSRYKIEFQVKS